MFFHETEIPVKDTQKQYSSCYAKRYAPHSRGNLYLKSRSPLDVYGCKQHPTVNKSTDALDCIFYDRKFE